MNWLDDNDSDVATYPPVRSLNPLMMLGNCSSSPFGIHMPDTFTLEGNLRHDVKTDETVRFSICCCYCQKTGVGAISIADIAWTD